MKSPIYPSSRPPLAPLGFVSIRRTPSLVTRGRVAFAVSPWALLLFQAARYDGGRDCIEDLEAASSGSMPMNTETPSRLGDFAPWIRSTDEHAEHRLRVAAEADRLLGATARLPGCIELADRLERWRYQMLDERRAAWTADDQRLADALDVAARRLAGRPRLAPRGVRSAVRGGSAAVEPEVKTAMAVLDPKLDLAEATARAAEATAAAFGSAASGARPGCWRIRLYAPLYLSNYCVNYCRYCNFRYLKNSQRRHLTVDEAAAESEILLGRGLRHQLLVSGEFPRLDTTDYFAAVVERLVARGVSPTIEVAPQSTASYAPLAAAGAVGVTMYQETYDERFYRQYHPRGPKRLYDWRLEGLDRAAEAGMGRLGLGILLGLAEPRAELLALVRHAQYLHERFPRCTLAFNLPRLHDSPPAFMPPYQIDDATFVRCYCALRLAFPQAELMLSTRESVELRNRLAATCITEFSAGSSTAPGGYGSRSSCEQFPVHDHRSVAEAAAWLHDAGFAVVS